MKNKDEQTGLVGLAIGAPLSGWFHPRRSSTVKVLSLSW